MTRPASRYPTELELEILKILWKYGTMSVRDVRQALRGFRVLAYTSVMTIMNIMTKKGYLKRSRSGRSYLYTASVPEKETRRGMLGDIVNRVFEGSALSVMTHLLETGDVDEAELEKLRNIIDRKVGEEEK